MARKPIRLALLLALAAMVGTTAISFGHPANAATKPMLSREQKRARLLELKRNGASDIAIKNELGLINVTKVPGAPKTPSVVRPNSRYTDASVSAPYVYHDTSNSEYIAYVNAVWQTSNWYSQDGPGIQACVNFCNEGGNEALGISFSNPIVNLGGFIRVCPSGWIGQTPYPAPDDPKYNCQDTRTTWDNSANGAAWRYQDGIWPQHCGGTLYSSCYNYFGGAGYITFTFRTLSSGCLQMFGTYVHTWNSTDISGLSVAPDGLEVTFQNVGSDWQNTSAAGLLNC